MISRPKLCFSSESPCSPAPTELCETDFSNSVQEWNGRTTSTSLPLPLPYSQHREPRAVLEQGFGTDPEYLLLQKLQVQSDLGTNPQKASANPPSTTTSTLPYQAGQGSTATSWDHQEEVEMVGWSRMSWEEGRNYRFQAAICVGYGSEPDNWIWRSRSLSAAL